MCEAPQKSFLTICGAFCITVKISPKSRNNLVSHLPLLLWRRKHFARIALVILTLIRLGVFSFVTGTIICL